MSLKLSELKALHEKGFALIYLEPRSKKPFEKGWTTAQPKSWEELENSFESDYNVGVRLGEPSKLKNGNYLGAIDCDVKSKSRKAIQEMNKALRDLGIDHKTAPVVMSGRGNGSKHIYVQTKIPMRAMKFAQSETLVKVLMLGSKEKSPSQKEIENLTKDELRQGYRIRRAWEISLMGTGQQTVLPPSVHPDTGFKYAWASPLSAKALPLFDAACCTKKDRRSGSESLVALDAVQDFKAEEVDLYESRLSLPVIQMIERGENCQDRSASLLSIAMSMCRVGFTDHQILSVLSDPGHWIGEAALERRKSRQGAVEWLQKYVLSKARFETDIMRRFENKPEMKRLSVKESEKLTDEIKKEAEELSKSNGFYKDKKPDYDALLKEWQKLQPYKTIADMKYVYAFNGTHYTDVHPFEIKAFAERMLFPKPEDKPRQEFLHKVFANNVTRRSFFLETTEGKFNFKNGVLSLLDKKLSPHSPEYGFRGVLPYEYDPEARCPQFKEWLDGVMMGNKKLTAILQEYMGYVIRGGEYRFHKALWLGGVGRNGKSTFIDILKRLIGTGNFSTISIRALMSDKFAGAELDGKLANFSEETSPQELADSGPFKNLTGDGELLVQKKYGDPYNIRNQAKLIMTYNQIPDLKDLSPGMLSRPLIIPFKKQIKEHEQDHKIKDKLSEELPGIFNFALAGWHRLERQNGFTRSTVSENALKKVGEESCNVFQWVENSIQTKEVGSNDPSFIKTARAMYEQYKNDERFPFKAPEFFRRLNKHPEINKRRVRKMDGRYYLGVQFLN